MELYILGVLFLGQAFTMSVPVPLHGLRRPKINGTVIFSDIESGSFRCRVSAEPTYVLKISSECKDYYLCTTKSIPEYFMCPDGTLFNRATLSCDENTRCEIPTIFRSPEISPSASEPSINHPSSEDYDVDRVSSEFISKRFQKNASADTLQESTPDGEPKINVSQPHGTQSTYDGVETHPNFYDVIVGVVETIQRMTSRKPVSATNGEIFSYATNKESKRLKTDQPSFFKVPRNDQTPKVIRVFNTDESLTPGTSKKLKDAMARKTKTSLFHNKALEGLELIINKVAAFSDHLLYTSGKMIKSITKRHHNESNTESSIKTDLWMDEFIVSIIRDLLNDEAIMLKITVLANRTFDIVVPLAEEMLVLSNENSSPIVGVRRETVEYTFQELKKEAYPILKDILIQTLPTVLLNISESVPSLFKFFDQAKYRLETSKYKIINKGISLLKKYDSVYEMSTEEHIFIYSLREIQKDIEAFLGTFSEVFQDNISRTSSLLEKHIGLWENIKNSIMSIIGSSS